MPPIHLPNSLRLLHLLFDIPAALDAWRWQLVSDGVITTFPGEELVGAGDRIVSQDEALEIALLAPGDTGKAWRRYLIAVERLAASNFTDFGTS